MSTAGIDVRRARGSELERRLAFGVVRQLFERTVRSATPAERDALFAEAADAARAVLEGAGTHGADTQFELLHGLFWFLVHVADRGPPVIVINDLHWADRWASTSLANTRSTAGTRASRTDGVRALAARTPASPMWRGRLGRHDSPRLAHPRNRKGPTEMTTSLLNLHHTHSVHTQRLRRLRRGR
jgi:hypothetical protein